MISYVVLKWLLWIHFLELVANKPRAVLLDMVFLL
jgi:hypothetical protein